MNNLLSTPEVLLKEGLNIIVFSKKTYVVKKQFEKEKYKEDFNMLCSNIESYNTISKIDLLLKLKTKHLSKKIKIT